MKWPTNSSIARPRSVVKGAVSARCRSQADGVNLRYSQSTPRKCSCCFSTGRKRTDRHYPVAQRDKFIWHGLVKEVKAGQLYGYKVRGAYRPEHGLRFNEAKLLLDPYAKAVTGKFRNVDNLLLAVRSARQDAGDLKPDTRDNTAIVPKGIVVADDVRLAARIVSGPRTGETHHLRSARQRFHRAPLIRRRVSRHLPRIHRERSLI